LGWSLAVLQHALWNGSLLVIGGFYGDNVSALRVVLIQGPLFTLPAVLVLWTIARFAGQRELAILRTQLAPEVASGVLTPREYATVTSDAARKSAVRVAAAQGGPGGKHRQQRFFQAAAELAFRKEHLARGERPAPGQEAPEDAYRAELALLRGQLAGVPPATE
jgi:hypothetical protein